MNIIGCLDVSDTRTYVLDGRAINQLKDSQLAEIRNRKIGFVIQSCNLLPRLSAYENVELPLIYQGMMRMEREPLVMKVLEAVDLIDRREHMPRNYPVASNSMLRSRVRWLEIRRLFWRMSRRVRWIRRPALRFMDIFTRLNDQGRTIILITHDHAIA
ncbi:putative ABC transport system ATP-binding protein [Paenibacillus sp. V4I5]|nr:putative ABC transport system ATP-binding protein [Paenibacillus sp. V4I5]